MKLSSQEEYGLRCLLQVARLEQGSPVPISDVAQREGLSTDYVAKLMRILRQHELVVSVRGPQGGYKLARSPEDITVHDAVVALDGPLFDGEFCEAHSGKQVSCVHSTRCSLRGLWRWVGSALEQALAGITLADLMRGESFVDSALPPLPAGTLAEVTP
jgi:Rrf2 family protein